MKKIIGLLLGLFLSSCGFNWEREQYNFNNFKQTPLWELAKAVRSDDSSKIKQILKDKKLDINFKEPNYQQTLLALAVQNRKKNAFVVLLKAGANSNELIGKLKDVTPFIYAIESIDNCDLFYVEAMLKYGANPNFEIQNPEPEYHFFNSFPLFVAIGKNDNKSNDCLELIKLLVDNGADINVCYKQSYSDFCNGVIGESLSSDSMETLRYFVVEKHITIPDTVIIFGEGDKLTQEAFGLEEVLKMERYDFEDFEDEFGKHDRSRLRKAKNDILQFLAKSKKEQKN